MREGEPVSPMGYVRVTNGGMPYDATDGKVSIPAGITVTLELCLRKALSSLIGLIFESNPVDAKKNSEYDGAEGSTGVTPEFVGKDKLEFKLAQTSSVYNGAAQLVSVTGTGNEACQITFFFDEACTQPAVLKNVDKYYVHVYRSADAKYKEYTEVFPYAIEQAEPAITKWPDASDILLGQYTGRINSTRWKSRYRSRNIRLEQAGNSAYGHRSARGYLYADRSELQAG